MPGQLDHVLDEHYLDDIGARPTDEIRRMRAECEEHEEAVSYTRRLVQGRLDILRAELLRRRDDGDASAEPLLAQLPDILGSPGEMVRSDPLHARATRLRVPATADALEAEVDRIVDEAALDDLSHQAPEQLSALLERLAAHEQQLSLVRRRLFAVIDALRAEMATRYKDGRAEVRDLLPGS